MAKRIEKLDNERWKGWDWAASNKLNEVIEAVNILELIVDSLNTMPDGSKHTLVMKDPTQAEPDKGRDPYEDMDDDELANMLGGKCAEPKRPSEPDTEQVDREIAASIQWLADEYVLPKNRDEFVDDALDVAEKIRNLLKGQS